MRTAFLLTAIVALIGCRQDKPSIMVTNAVIAAGPQSAAVYADIDNRGGADRLTGIEIASRVPISLHQTSNDGGVVRMRRVDELEVSANGRLELKSGGAHGMAMGKVTADPPRVPLTFRFARSGPVAVSARLTGPGRMEEQR